MARGIRLTKLIVDRAAYVAGAKGHDIRWDTEIPGFALRIYPSGRKSYMLRYWIHGRKRRMIIGDCRLMTLDEARREARIKIGEVSGGGDPLADRERRSRGKTVAELSSAFLELYAKPKKKSWTEDERRINLYLLPRWKKHWVKSIQHRDVTELRHELGKRSIYEANRTVALISTMWEFGRREGFIERTDDNPARGVEKYREKKRDRWVTPEEMPRLVTAINRHPSIYVRAGLWLLLLLGLRRSELLKARWEYVDFERRMLSLPDTKAGKPHHVPLGGAAISILRSIPRVEGNPHILPGQKDGAPLVNISKPWSTIRKEAGLMDVRIHDLRRTVGSMIVQTGGSLYLAQHVLGHKDSKTTEVYARFAQNHLRTPLEEHGERLVQLGGVRPAVDIRNSDHSCDKPVNQ